MAENTKIKANWKPSLYLNLSIIRVKYL